MTSLPVSPKTMKSFIRSRKRRRSKTPLSTVSSSGVPLDTTLSPVTVRHGMNRSRSAVSEPMRAAMPSEITSAALVRNKRSYLRLVGLQLVERTVEGCVLVAGVLEFDDTERKAVDEDHHVRAAVRLVFDDGVLVHRQPVVGVWIIKVDQAHLVAADSAVSAPDLDRNTLDHVAMQPPVLRYERRRLRLKEPDCSTRRAFRP